MKKDKYKDAYLAPLNFDRFFKKVFSDKKIAKRFIEDFLDIKIHKIEPLDREKRLSDDAKIIEFDYYCKIDNNKHIIIDMQQWYKPDVVYRFYIYHCSNTLIQLEDLPLKEVLQQDGKLKKIKDYSTLTPVITIIWMVEDNLGSKADFNAYTMLPEKSKEFFEETEVWKHKDIETKVKEILYSINNNSKDLQFLQKNRLIFAFQQNIVENDKLSKYKDWFTLAEKSRNSKNTKEDFDDYRKDKILVELTRRLLKSKMSDEDLEYIETEDEIRDNIERYNNGMRREGRNEGIEQERERSKKIIKRAEEEKRQAEEEKKQAEEEKKQANLKAEVYKLLFKGKSKNEISQLLEISIVDIDKILK